MVRSKLHPTMLFTMFLPSSWKMWGFMFCMSKFTSFHCLILNLFIGELTLCYWLIAFTPRLMLLLLIPLEHIWFCGLFHLMGHLDQSSHCDLILQVVFCHMVAMTMVSHAKLFYYDWHSTYAFFPLVIKVFGCLHQQANNFLYQCANMVRLAKGFGGPPLAILHAFYQ